MENFHIRFPTRTLMLKESKLNGLLSKALLWSREHKSNPKTLTERVQHAILFIEKFHESYADWQNEALKQHNRPVSCSKGCATCCQHYPMSVESMEALRLYTELRTRDDFRELLEAFALRKATFSRLVDQTSSELEDEEREDQALREYYKLGLRCPLLQDDGSCTVHSKRPITCRMYFSFTEGRYCAPDFLHTEKNESFHVCLSDSMEESLGEYAEMLEELELEESLYGALLGLNLWENQGLFP